jgi:hypothetical protein
MTNNLPKLKKKGFFISSRRSSLYFPFFRLFEVKAADYLLRAEAGIGTPLQERQLVI